MIVNGYTEIKSKEMFYSPNIPKVFDKNDNLLYVQSSNPSNKKNVFIKSWRQVHLFFSL